MNSKHFLVEPQQPVSTQLSLIRSQIGSWISSPAFIDLLRLYDSDFAPSGELDSDLELLEQFSDKWDFRRIARAKGAATDDGVAAGAGSARWLSAETNLSTEDEERVISDARALGLVDASEPSRSAYDHFLILGGARLSCRLRPICAAELIQSGISTGSIILLGAARPIEQHERDATNTYAPGAADEYDLLIAGSQEAFQWEQGDYHEERHDDPTNRNLSWVHSQFKSLFHGHILQFDAFSAPSSDPLHRRANSADTWNFFAERAHVKPESTLLLITSQIYVPYVQLEALRTLGLPRHLYVETVGFPGTRMPALQGLTRPSNYLQEIRSTIQAARRFCLAFAKHEGVNGDPA